MGFLVCLKCLVWLGLFTIHLDGWSQREVEPYKKYKDTREAFKSLRPLRSLGLRSNLHLWLLYVLNACMVSAVHDSLRRAESERG
jgi:hypothetical protein